MRRIVDTASLEQRRSERGFHGEIVRAAEAGALGKKIRRDAPDDSQGEKKPADLVPSRAAQRGPRAHKGARDDCDEGTGLEPGVAADQFVRLQVNGQQPVLQRAEHRRDKPECDDDDPHSIKAVFVKGAGRAQHDEGLEGLERPDKGVPWPDVRNISRPAGNQHKGKDEEPADQVHRVGRVPAVGGGESEGAQQHEGVLEDVVAECADELGDKQRQEAPGGEHAHGAGSTRLRSGRCLRTDFRADSALASRAGSILICSMT